MFPPFVYESLSYSKCEKMDLKIKQALLKRVQYAEDAGKPKSDRHT